MRDVLARGDAPVVLVDPVAIAVDIGAALAADRIGLAAHRSIVQAAIAYRARGAGRAAAAALRGQARPGRGAAVARAGARAGAPGGGARRRASSWSRPTPDRRRPRAGAEGGDARHAFRPPPTSPASIRYVEASGARRGRAGQRARRRAGGRVARPRNRRLHARTSASDRAFRRLSWPASRGFAAPSRARACVKFPGVFNLGMGEITVILLLALIFIGPKKLPDLASGLGRIIRQIRKTTADVKNEIVLDDTFRKPFEELRDAVTLAPEELKRRDALIESVRKQAEELARSVEASVAATTPPEPPGTPAARARCPPEASPTPWPPPPGVVGPLAAAAARAAATPPPPSPLFTPPVSPPVGTFPRSPTPFPLQPGRLGGPGRVTPPFSSLDGKNANVTQTLSEEDLMPARKGGPPPPLPPPLPGVAPPPPPGTRRAERLSTTDDPGSRKADQPDSDHKAVDERAHDVHGAPVRPAPAPAQRGPHLPGRDDRVVLLRQELLRLADPSGARRLHRGARTRGGVHVHGPDRAVLGLHEAGDVRRADGGEPVHHLGAVEVRGARPLPEGEAAGAAGHDRDRVLLRRRRAVRLRADQQAGADLPVRAVGGGFGSAAVQDRALREDGGDGRLHAVHAAGQRGGVRAAGGAGRARLAGAGERARAVAVQQVRADPVGRRRRGADPRSRHPVAAA